MDARVKPAHDELVTTSVDIAPFGITPSCTIAFLFRRGTRWPVRFLYFPVFLQIRHLPSPVSRSQTTHTPPFPRRISCARGLHLCFTHPESRGGRSAEKRSGARRNTRGACHLASKTRVNALMTRHARRLRGALRPMTRGTTGANNVTISMVNGASVPIVSRTPDRIR